MSEEYTAKIRQSLIEYIKQNNKSQSQISKELNISKTALSLYLTGSYIGDNEEISNKIKQFLSMSKMRRSLTKDPEINITIGNTEKILDKVLMTHISNDILLIYGSAGCGKTTALKYYAENKNGVLYVQADATAATPRPILSLILNEMGEKSVGTVFNMKETIIHKLKDSNRLIIIDEAQHLTEKSFDMLRALNDKANIGIVYAGNPSILKRMYGRKEEEFDQVYSRIGYQCEVSNKYSFEDIKHLFNEFNIPIPCLKYLHKISQRKGGLRQLIKQFKIALNISKALNEDFNINHLEESAEQMGIHKILWGCLTLYFIQNIDWLLQ